MALRIAQPSFAAGELTPALYARVDLAKYNVGARQLKNFFVHAHGGASNRPGTDLVDYALGVTRLIPFQYNAEQTYMLAFSNAKMRVIKDGGLVVSGEDPLEVASPYAAADLPGLKFTQSADVLYLTHPGLAPRALTRSSHVLWTFSTLLFAAGIAAPTGLAGSYNGEDSPYNLYYKVAAVSDAGEESLPSAAVTVQAHTSGNWEAGTYVSLSWSAVTGADYYRVYANKRGYYGLIGTTEDLSFRDDNITPAADDGPQGDYNPFPGAGDYPGVAAIFEQRLVFGRTNNSPQTVFASQTGIFTNFCASRPLRDTDRILAALASTQVNEIRWLVPFDELVVLTSGGEWIMANGSNSDALTPTSVQYKVQGYRGCADVRPLVIGSTVLFVQRGGKVVRDLQYKLETDKYASNNLSVLSEHLFRDCVITSWAYQQTPDSVIWVALSDGTFCSFTYLPEHEVWAWCPQETDGVVEEVAAIPGDDEDEVYFVIKRTIDGEDVRFIEKLHSRRFTSVEDAYFVDCGLSYDGEPATEITGLDHLLGKTVAILADGNVVPPQEVREVVEAVVDGPPAQYGIVLPNPASVVHVGLPYTSTLETLNVDLTAQGDTLQGKKKVISRVTLRLEDTREISVGPDEDHLVQHPFRTDEGYEEATRLFTGDKTIVMRSSWGTDGRVMIQQPDPLPVTVLAVIPEVTPGG